MGECLSGAATVAEMSVLVPVGLFGLGEGFNAPDLDITFGRIGFHRNLISTVR